MAKASKAPKLTGKAIAPAPGPANPVEAGDFPDALSLINSLAAARDGIEWDCRVYKVEGAGRGVRESQPFLFNVQLEDLPTLEAELAQQFPAGGQFRVQVRADNQLIKNIRLDIAARPGYVPPRPSYLAPVAPPVAESQSTDRMEMFFARLAEAQERSARETRELIASIASKTAAAPTLADQLQMFAQFQAMLPKGAQENSMELFQKGMDFATKIFEARGGGDGGTSWLDVVKEALGSPVMKDALLAIAAAAQNQNTPALNAPAALVSQANPAAVNAIDTLIKQAQGGVDPKFVAQQVYNSLPPALLDELEQQEDVVQYLIAQFPAVAQYRPWFTALVAEMWEEEHNSGPSPAMQGQQNAGPENPIKPPA